MTVSNITTSNASSVGQSNWKSTIQQGREDFQQLLQAMQAGDVSSAQQSYAAIQQLTNPASGSTAGSDASAAASTASVTGTGNAVLTDWNQLGQALQSGSLSSAQSAFSQLQQDAQTAASQGHHHHHHAINQAQSVYSAMGNDGDGDDKVAASGATGSTGATGRGALQSDLSAAQQALQSGDTQAAQNLLAKLQQDLMASGHHRHWANAAANNTDTTNTASTTTTQSATAAV